MSRDNAQMTEVVAALIWNEAGQILICQRPAHKARALLWEFPGGKVEKGETREQALLRECREELGVELAVGPLFKEVTHLYPDLLVRLLLYHARIASGALQKLEHAAIAWAEPARLEAFEFCPADKGIVSEMARGITPPDFGGDQRED